MKTRKRVLWWLGALVGVAACARGDGGNEIAGRRSALTSACAPGVTSLAVGDDHSCAVLGDGTVQCWGANNLGQLGDGTTQPSPTPVTVTGVSPGRRVVVGARHSCAWIHRTAMCWGSNALGQLGTTTSGAFSTSAVTVDGLTGTNEEPTSISAGGDLTCVGNIDNFNHCWGDTNSAPVLMLNLSISDAMPRSGPPKCALTTFGSSVQCWGDNSEGQLGDGTTTSSANPVAPLGITGVTWLATSDFRNCAVLSDRSVKCWGDQSSGALGFGSTPVVVDAAKDVAEVSSGLGLTCLLRDDGSVQCLRGTATPRRSVALSGPATQVSLGGSTACAALASGAIECWGWHLGGGALLDAPHNICLLPVGNACSNAADCGSGFCVDGVCCGTATCGSCQACNVPGSAGTCTPVAAGAADPRLVCHDDGAAACGTDGKCDGAGGCRHYANGTPCAAPSCPSGAPAAALSGTCNGGSCAVPTATCAPYVCQGGVSCPSSCNVDADCAPGHYCTGANGGCVSQKGAGDACSSSSQCATGHCVDGVCCGSASCGSCQACNLPGSAGACAPVAVGSADPLGVCQDNGAAACGTDGKCDGAGGCRTYANGTVCSAASCPGGSAALTLAGSCSAGVCSVPPTQSCGAYACNGAAACRSTCNVEGDCASGNYCAGGSCLPKKNQGDACAGDGQCGTGHCVDGVCCGSATCGDACHACNLAGSVGTCAALAAGTACDEPVNFCDGVRQVCTTTETGNDVFCPAAQSWPPTDGCKAVTSPSGYDGDGHAVVELLGGASSVGGVTVQFGTSFSPPAGAQMGALQYSTPPNCLPPTGFAATGVAWNLETSGTWVDALLPVVAIFNYDPSPFASEAEECALTIYHGDAATCAWTPMGASADICPSTGRNCLNGMPCAPAHTIRGTISNHFSPFGMFAPQPSAIPKVTVPGALIVEAAGPDGASVPFPATATDAKDGTLQPTCTPASGTKFPIGTTPVTCTATNSLKIVGSASFTVTVRDSTGPVWSNVPGPVVSAFATSTAGAKVTYALPRATDAVDGSRPVTCMPASGSQFPVNKTTVTCKATDKRGNRSAAAFTVWVKYDAPTAGRFFLPPIRSDGSSVFKIGRPVPVSFRLTGGCNRISNLVARLVVTKVSNSIRGTHDDFSGETVEETDMLFKYRAGANIYIYRWKTSNQTKGTYQLRADLGDGLTHQINVSLKP